MKVLYNWIGLLISVSLFSSCEEVIDLKLKDAGPKYVIQADLNNVSNKQLIKISQSVDFDKPYPSKAVSNASVSVIDASGNSHNFISLGNGNYENNNFQPMRNGAYSLKVNVDDEVFNSTTNRVSYVEVDSVELAKEQFMNDEYYVIIFNFKDPKDEENYYKYSYSVNGGPFKFFRVFSDRYNNGLAIKQEITERDDDNKFAVGDYIVVQRECIYKDVYKFWSDWQSINPGSAAPFNPQSNISNNALGYFSVSSAKLYDVVITQIDSYSTDRDYKDLNVKPKSKK